MKKKLFGALALALCVIMMMPAAMAEVYGFYYDKTCKNPVTCGDLLVGGAKLWAAEDDWLSHGFITCEEKTEEFDIGFWKDPEETEYERSFKLPSHKGSYQILESLIDDADGSNNILRISAASLSGPVIDQEASSAGQKIIGFQDISGGFDEKGNFVPADRVIDDFQAKLKSVGLLSEAWTTEYYDIGKYKRPYDTASFWQRVDDQQPETFTIPLKDVQEPRVFHWNPDGVDEVTDVKITPEGVEVLAYHFSPFAVVYNEGGVPAVPAAPAAPSSSAPKTGDGSQLALWFALAGLSLTGMAALALRRRKRA